MVLSRYESLTRIHILYGLIRAVMAEFHFNCLASQGKGYYLMSKAYAKYRHASSQLSEGIYYLGYIFRIAGAV